MDSTKIHRTMKIEKESNLYSAIEKVGTVQKYGKGEMVYFQDDAASEFYLIKSGRVRLFLTSAEGNEITLKLLGPNMIFGDASHLSHTPRLTSASTVTDVELLTVDIDRMLTYMTLNPSLMIELYSLMAQTIRLLSIQVYSMAFLSSDKKVAHILVQLGTYFKETESDSHYSIDYTHQEIAELIGIARVTTTKILKQFEKQGWISLGYHHITVNNEQALKQYQLS
ncbi:Crp/Fnr family transcriptional regulator [Niallia endozanthoxylica]|uniref:Crp/Fnr family transcriptional regulator n=1 Tax=Niallia endozanthoxylica TaxID=2036016 RepID=A0A5J5I0J1_9BACI|nr:Crp/Fnr family transcriptional regulator [Niallia endozanthoxylica]KAA9028433.1 Crp/Fnr family transcriptional regulator [Niallia endozanthoxylica]